MPLPDERRASRASDLIAMFQGKIASGDDSVSALKPQHTGVSSASSSRSPRPSAVALPAPEAVGMTPNSTTTSSTTSDEVPTPTQVSPPRPDRTNVKAPPEPSITAPTPKAESFAEFADGPTEHRLSPATVGKPVSKPSSPTRIPSPIFSSAARRRPSTGSDVKAVDASSSVEKPHATSPSPSASRRGSAAFAPSLRASVRKEASPNASPSASRTTPARTPKAPVSSSPSASRTTRRSAVKASPPVSAAKSADGAAVPTSARARAAAASDARTNAAGSARIGATTTGGTFGRASVRPTSTPSTPVKTDASARTRSPSTSTTASSTRTPPSSVGRKTVTPSSAVSASPTRAMRPSGAAAPVPPPPANKPVPTPKPMIRPRVGLAGAGKITPGAVGGPRGPMKPIVATPPATAAKRTPSTSSLQGKAKMPVRSASPVLPVSPKVAVEPEPEPIKNAATATAKSQLETEPVPEPIERPDASAPVIAEPDLGHATGAELLRSQSETKTESAALSPDALAQWGTRDGAGEPISRTPSPASALPNGVAPAKKVPIWMRKGGATTPAAIETADSPAQ